MHLQHIHIDCSFQSLMNIGQSFNAPVLENSFIADNDQCKGHSKRAEVEKGLCLQIWDFYLKDDVTFTNVVSQVYAEKYFCLHYFFSPNSALIEISNLTFDIENLEKLNALVSTDTEVKLGFKKDDHIICITLIFTQKWLTDQFRNSTGFQHINLDWMDNHQPIVLPNRTSNVEQFIARELFAQVNSASSILQTKVNIFYLLDSKLARIPNNKASVEPDIFRDHNEVAIHLEKKITNSLRGKMPSMQELSKEFYMSESTLQRNFKKLFGMNIYEYYLRKKMELARNMLILKKLNVSQVANALGYESVSHFDSMFKKIYNMSPGKIKNDE